MMAMHSKNHTIVLAAKRESGGFGRRFAFFIFIVQHAIVVAKHFPVF
jgi:hypothetical protein